MNLIVSTRPRSCKSHWCLMMMDSNILTFLTPNPQLANLQCQLYFVLTSNWFDNLIVTCNLLCGMDVLFECRRIILWALLCIFSWSQRLVMAKDPCETTITKRLACLMEQLVLSSHEFFFIIFLLFLLCFQNYFQNIFIIFLWLFLSPS